MYHPVNSDVNTKKPMHISGDLYQIWYVRYDSYMKKIMINKTSSYVARVIFNNFLNKYLHTYVSTYIRFISAYQLNNKYMF